MDLGVIQVIRNGLPSMVDCIDSLGEANCFTTLDANCGCWQIVMDAKDKHKTPFATHCGTYQYARMPFRSQERAFNISWHFDMILAGYGWDYCLVYIDDVIIISKTFEEHLHHVERTLIALQGAGDSGKVARRAEKHCST